MQPDPWKVDTLGAVADFVEAVWPSRCALCDAADAGDGLGCAEHRLACELEGPRCARCAAAIAPMLPEGERCPDCRARAPAFASVAALGEYRALATAAWVLALKYGGRPDLAEPLGQLLAARLALEPPAAEPRVLVPVPLHPARRIDRGYDQALWLARAAGRHACLPVVRALRRTRATPVQGALGTVSRAANVRAAFAAARFPPGRARRVAGKEAWLVDDVVTSGATAGECARVLRRLGAARVRVLCVARA